MLFLKKRYYLFLASFILIYSLKNSPNIVEEYYSLFFYKHFSQLILFIFNRINFSIGDLFYLSLPFIFYLYFKNTTTRREKISKILTFLFSLYIIFNVNWGLNYYRVGFSENSILKTKNIDQLLSTTNLFIKNINNLHNKITFNDSVPVDFKNYDFNLYKESVKSIVNSEFYNLDHVPKVKNSLFSTPLSYMGFGGYINPFTLEAQININTPKLNQPTTICHEIAHQLGYSSEYEANFIGIVSTINSKNKIIQYSGLSSGLRYLMNDIFVHDKKIHSDLVKKINKGVIINFNKANEQLRKYNNPFEIYFKKSYDSFLKINNQTEGIKSYSLVVNLLIERYSSQLYMENPMTPNEP